jgi:hypothetical protein
MSTSRGDEVQRDRPRLLAARSEHGYTTNPLAAMKDEPEAVSEVKQAELTVRSRRAERERLRDAWRPAHSLITAAIVGFLPVADRRSQSDLRVIERTAARIDQRLAGQ